MVGGLVERSQVTADDIAAAVLAGMDAGDDVIVPDEAARQAYFLKWADRPAYDAVMRDQAAQAARRPIVTAVPGAREVREEDAFDVARVAAWLRAHADDARRARRRARGPAVHRRRVEPDLPAALSLRPRPDRATRAGGHQGQGCARHAPRVRHPVGARAGLRLRRADGRLLRRRRRHRRRLLRDGPHRRRDPPQRVARRRAALARAGARAVPRRRRRARRAARHRPGGRRARRPRQGRRLRPAPGRGLVDALPQRPHRRTYPTSRR